MKKIITGIVGCLGVVSSLLAIIDALPEYNNIFLVLIGVAVGYALGIFAPNNEGKDMTAKNKSLLFICIMFLLPPLLLVGVVAAIASLGLMTEVLLTHILGWGVFAIIIAYIVAGIVAYNWSSMWHFNNVTNPKDSDDDTPNNNA